MKSPTLVVPAVVPVRADSRLASLDAARFVAALGVIWIHASSFAQIGIARDPGFAGRFALPFFTFTAVLFACDAARKPQRSLGGYALGRLRRLYLPFIAWTIAYLGLKQLRFLVLHDSEPLALSLSILWDGGSYHLWFLPFLYAMTVAAFALGKLQSRHERMLHPLLAGALIAGAVVALIPNPLRHHSPLVMRYGWDVVPAALWAVSVASWRYLARRRSENGPLDRWPRLRAGGWLWCASGLAVVVVCIAGLCVPGPHVLLRNVAGLGFALAAFSGVRGRVIEHLRGLGSLAFGVYLVHIMPTGLMRGQGLHLHLDPTGVTFALVMMAVVMLASLVAASVLRQFHAGAWLILGAPDRSDRADEASEAGEGSANRAPRPAEAQPDPQALGTPTDLLLGRLRDARVG